MGLIARKPLRKIEKILRDHGFLLIVVQLIARIKSYILLREVKVLQSHATQISHRLAEGRRMQRTLTSRHKHLRTQVFIVT